MGHGPIITEAMWWFENNTHYSPSSWVLAEDEALNLWRCLRCCFTGSIFVNMSATWAEKETNAGVIFPALISSRMKWLSTPTCFVRSWSTGLAARARADLLSQCRVVDGMLWIPRSQSSVLSQVTSHTVRAIALYSASADDLATTFCFLVFHEIGKLPRKTQ